MLWIVEKSVVDLYRNARFLMLDVVSGFVSDFAPKISACMMLIVRVGQELISTSRRSSQTGCDLSLLTSGSPLPLLCK